MIRHIERLLVALVFLLGATPRADAATIQVTTTAQIAQPGEGCTITDAILTAQSALPYGNCTIAGVGEEFVIHIPAGTYVLTTSSPYFDESSTAFPIITQPLTIEGEGPGTIIVRDSNAPAFRLFRGHASLEIRQLTLSGGDAGTNSYGAKHPGGAILGDDVLQTGLVTITVRNVTFENNRAGSGGAIAVRSNTYGHVAVTVEDSTFRGNNADLGGAISIPPNGSLTVLRSRFVDNVAVQSGGAIDAAPSTVPIQIEDSEFETNHASNQDGGAIHSSGVRLTRVAMWGNTAHNGGGALEDYGGAVEIVDSTFAANIARRGGAIAAVAQGEPVLVSGSTFYGNEATQSDGGAIFLDDRTGLSRIVNSTFSGNRAYVEGTAISMVSGGLTLINDTIVGNSTSGSWGPALRGYSSGAPSIRVSNSIIAGNTTGGSPLDIYVDQGRPDAIFSLGSNLIGNVEGTNGVFVQPGDRAGTPASPLDPGLLPLGDYGGPTLTHGLASGSLALDAGSALAPGTPGDDAACLAVDQRGVRRPGAGTPHCDIGAFEHAITFSFTLHVGSGGSVIGLHGETPCTVAGGDACSATVDSGTVVNLQAQLTSGFSFAGWLGGGCEGVSPQCSVTMNGDQTVTATFRLVSAGTTTVVSSSPNPSVNGQEVTFTAVVQSAVPTDEVPSGRVEFQDVTAGTILGTANLAFGSASVIASLPAGTHAITATYTGGGPFMPSSGRLSHRVTAANSSIALSSSAAHAVSGQPVTFTAIVSAVAPGAGTPTGIVTFKNITQPGGVTLDTVTLDGSGTATVTTAALPVGVHSIEAVYTAFVGDAVQKFEQSSAVILQHVSLVSTTTVLTSSANPYVSGQPLTLTARVSAVAPGTGIPSGIVAFVDADTGAALGTAAVDTAGNAVLINPPVAPGTHTIAAGYGGDAAFATSSGYLLLETLPASLTLAFDEDIFIVEDFDLAPPANTPVGNNVIVSPDGTPVTVRFAQITAPGVTTVVAVAGPPPPAGFMLTTPPTVFEITTSAVYAGEILVCITYPAGTQAPQLMHFEGGVWIDRTTSIDAATLTVCGSVTSLSPFAVFTPEGAEGRMTGAGSIAGGHRFDFRVAERSIGEERAALHYSHKTAQSGNGKPRIDELRATSIGSIVFRDDPAYRPSRGATPAVDSVVFTGTGTWNGAPGYSFEVAATDQGEPGRGRDTFAIVVRSPQGAIVASSDGVLTEGAIQSQRLRHR